MLVVSRVLPKINDDNTTKNESRKRKQTSIKSIRKAEYENQKKLAKINLIDSMLVIHKVKFVDTEKFNSIYKEEEKQNFSIKDRGSSFENPKKLKKIKNKISLLYRNEEIQIKNCINNISGNKIKPKLKPLESVVSKFSCMNLKNDFHETTKITKTNRKFPLFNFQNSLRDCKEKEGSVSPTNKINKTFTVFRNINIVHY
jgi:hypothetical protein